jgi:hypothetical protein
MTPPTTSTSPMERFRCRFVASSHASQRQNSTALNSDSWATVSRRLVIRDLQISTVSPSGTKYSVSTSMPARRELMIVYPRPWRQW